MGKGKFKNIIETITFIYSHEHLQNNYARTTKHRMSVLLKNKKYYEQATIIRTLTGY